LLACVCCAGWAFGFGLETPLASLAMRDAGASVALIGANTGSHFLGVLLIGPFVPVLMRRFGRAGLAIGLACSGLGVAAFPWGDGPVGWFALRILAGVGGAVAMISLETIINWNAPPDRRARDFALYACSVGVGFALGSFAGLQLYSCYPRVAFLVGGAVSLAAAPLIALLPAFPDDGAPAVWPVRWRPPFLSLASAWTQGFLEIGLLALLPLYLRFIGLTDDASGLLIGGILVGALAGQLPIGWLADRFGREPVLISCFLLVAIALASTPGASDPVLRDALLATIGVCSGAFYPLGLAILGERVPPGQLARANAWYLSVNCFGSFVSPFVAGPAMEQFGPSAMFWTGEAVVVTVLVGWLATRRRASQRAQSGAETAGPLG
jgi:MFS family permease